ncbi:AAA family ATPase [Devosia sp. MC532]|uniref:AAA family ATPase n=1 Tax=Devosia sp. MC532 TaxID=2799788 RepID=UPI0018F5A2E8|nr:AAA family ATPase [Devosia sp. MC532]MBJ7579344.1 AAA family ATPase [Devosia sp. MC532]
MSEDNFTLAKPDTEVSIRHTFGIDVDGTVPAFSTGNEHVPTVDPGYQFDPSTTMAILAGFRDNLRVLLQGRHGTGKSSHIEQVAARLNWPCVRLNLDSHVSRIDLIGKDAIVLRDGKQVTDYREGLLPWCYQRPVVLILDEYDAGRPDVMFVIQRILEADGKLTIMDQNKVIPPNPYFRLFATANTVGLGDVTGLYHGTQQLNQAQLDRWNVVARLDYLSEEAELNVVLSKQNWMADEPHRSVLLQMVRMANLTRSGFTQGDVSVVMSPRTVISWAQNLRVFGDLDFAFHTSFLNRCDEVERATYGEYYQRCFGRLPGDAAPELWTRL